MLYNDKEWQVKDFPINKDYGDDEDFFRIITDDGEVQLTKMPFQVGHPLPDMLSCRIKGYNGKLPIIGHNMPQYVNDFYADGFSKGQEFEFKVVSTQDSKKGLYRVADDNGLIFKLHETSTTLSKGQSVKCRFEVMEQHYFKLKRSLGDTQFQMVPLGEIAKTASIYGLGAAKLHALLGQIPELTEALDELDHGRTLWIMTAIRAIKPIMPRIFKEVIENQSYDTVLDIIKGYERVLLYLLQGSGFLRNVKGNERLQLQQELTAQIEQLDVYKRTLRIVSNNEQRKFIDNLLDNLKESGYIYHPTTQFSIMMILFRMTPELVNTSLGNIFDTLMGWDPETWKTEPFRQAFVEQLEIYIRETREDIDRFLQAETAADNEKIEKALTAIAIQHSLATGKDIVDTRLNTSLFYRYLSLLRGTKAGVLLHKSYLALMGVTLPTDYTWADIKEPTMMMTRAAVDPPSTAVLPQDKKYFISDNIEVEIGPQGISIAKVNEDYNNALPNGMLPWPGLEVKVDRTINRQKMKTMDGHAEFWNAIESDLFVPESDAVEQISSRRTPDIDDTVRIIIDRVIPSARDFNRIEAFECKIVDDHFVEGRGILPAENIVNYNLHGVTSGTFRRDNGEHMIFDAQVVDIDENDCLIFSLADTAYLAIRDMANAGEKCLCVVTKDNGRSYSAISERGFGLYVNKDNDGGIPYHRGNIIRVSITGYSSDAIQSVVEEGPIDNYIFSNARAFRNLLLAIAVNTEEDNNEDLEIDEEDTIDAEDLREIIEILRFKAVSCRDNILMAFDYLCYARLLALTIGDEALASTIKAHKDILLLHQSYAKNKVVYADDIVRVMEAAHDSTLIQRMASRLLIVASLGHSEDNSHLWTIANTSTNDMEKDLAQMVLSYNLLYDMDHNDPSAATIKDKIAQKLNVESEQRTLKYYGSENQYVEFKSSLVYPAKKGKAGLSMADPDRQEFEILHIIAGFLNSTGGTLYIGVNDDHYERGLEEDFNFYRMDTSERNTKYRRSIKSLDNLANYLQNLIDSSFNLGKIAGDYAKTAVDDESVKGVIAVKIDPCPHIVYLDNKIFVRHSAKTEPLTRADEIEIFKADRQRLYSQLMAATAPVEASDAQKPELEMPVAPAAIPMAEADASDSYEIADNFSVATSRIRKNILHEYSDPDHFVTPCAYIRFIDEDKFKITKDEWSIDENDRLALTVTDEEADGLLLLIYEGGYAIKVRMREVLGKNENVACQHYADRKLVFASPIAPGAGVYSMHSNAKNTLYERVTPLDKIPQGSMTTAPERLMDIDNVDTVMYEVVTPGKMPEMSAILSTTMKRAQIGSLVKGISSVKTSVDEAISAACERLK